MIHSGDHLFTSPPDTAFVRTEQQLIIIYREYKKLIPIIYLASSVSPHIDMNKKNRRRVKSAETVFGIIEALHELGTTGPTEVANRLNLSKSTVHDHLATLEDLEYVIAEGGEYRLSLKFLDHGIVARNELDIVDIAKPSLDQMADESGDVAWLIVEEHGSAVYLDKAIGENGVQTAGRIGKRTHLHFLGAGKSILAQLSEKRLKQIVDERGLPKRTENTITDLDELLEQLDQIREAGIALNDGEEVLGVRAVGAPITYRGKVVGAVSLSGPSKRLTGERFRETLPDIVLRGANEIELKLEYQ